MKTVVLLLGGGMLIVGCASNKTLPRTSTVSFPSRPTISPTRPTAQPTPFEVRTERSRDRRFEARGFRFQKPTSQNNVEVRDAKTSRVLATWNTRSDVTSFDFSPDGRLLAIGTSDNLAVWNWKSKQRLFAHKFYTGDQFPVLGAFSPDGQQLAVTFGSLLVFDVKTWKSHHFPDLGEPAFVDQATWSPNGRWLALSQHDVVSYSLVDVRTGRVGGLEGGDAYCDPVFSPDSRFLAGSTAETCVWRVSDGKRIASLGGDYEHVRTPITFSSDNRFLVCEEHDGRRGVWRTRDGKQIIAPQQKIKTLGQLLEQVENSSKTKRRVH